MRWQPIDTYVQKEKNERVLIFVPDSLSYDTTGVAYRAPRVGEAEFGGFEPGKWAWANDSCSCCWSSVYGTPTLWMPLPPPPQ